MGDNIIIPMAIKILATTKSIIKKGINEFKKGKNESEDKSEEN